MQTEKKTTHGKNETHANNYARKLHEICISKEILREILIK
jgi:hypothetical protein